MMTQRLQSFFPLFGIGSLLSIEEGDEGSENATVHFFCPDANQATAVEQAVRGVTGIDLIVSLFLQSDQSIVGVRTPAISREHCYHIKQCTHLQ